MAEIIAPTTAAATHELNITTSDCNQALVVIGDLSGSEVITIEQLQADGTTWRQKKNADGPIQLEPDLDELGIYAAVGQIRINKPVTANAVGVAFGA